MSEEIDDDDDDEADEDAANGKKSGKGKIIAIAAALAVVLLGGGGGAAYYFGLFGSLLDGTVGSTTAVIELGEPVIHELPEIKADLKTGKCRAPFLRTTIAVQLGSNDVQRLQTMELQITDSVRSYLRDQERQDMVGAHGTERLRFDLTRIVNNLIAPASIHAIIFKDFIVQ